MRSIEGDVISCIRNNILHTGHFHKSGVPGRHGLDENQELYYSAIMRAIKETGYDGYVGQELSPRNGADWVVLLEAAYRVCDVWLPERMEA